MAKVRKRSGRLQAFNKSKIVKACKKAGAGDKSAMAVAEEVAKKVGKGTKCRETFEARHCISEKSE